MDELDLFRDFRRGVAAPSEDALGRASATLARALRREQSPRTAALRLIRKRPGYSALALVALAAATATALLVGTPWNDSPGFLAKAQAALAPRAGKILHEKWEVTVTSTDPACTVTRGPNEIWIDQTPPYRYRALLKGFPPDLARADPRALVCSIGTAVELGGTRMQTLMFVPVEAAAAGSVLPPNKLSASPLHYMHPLDPVTELREAIAAGRAHDEGKTQLDGRTVERIRIEPPSDCPDPNCPRESSYAYVDPETFYPVQLESPHGYIVLGSVVRFHFVMRTLTFEYLPRTAANLALTDIRAQHPDATGP
jgi:hypothetical protein